MSISTFNSSNAIAVTTSRSSHIKQWIWPRLSLTGYPYNQPPLGYRITVQERFLVLFRDKAVDLSWDWSSGLSMRCNRIFIKNTSLIGSKHGSSLMFLNQVVRCEVPDESDIMIGFTEAGDMVNDYCCFATQQKRYFSPMEYRIIHIHISIMGNIHQEVGIRTIESVANRSDSPHTADIRECSHFMIINIERVVSQCAEKVMSPIFPYGAVIDVSSAVYEDVLTLYHQLKMGCVIMSGCFVRRAPASPQRWIAVLISPPVLMQ